nr:hypothetical protein [Herbaspirillum sp. B39]
MGHTLNIAEFARIVGFAGHRAVGCYRHDFPSGVPSIASLIKTLITAYLCEVFCSVWIVRWQEEFDRPNRMANSPLIGAICQCSSVKVLL